MKLDLPPGGAFAAFGQGAAGQADAAWKRDDEFVLVRPCNLSRIEALAEDEARAERLGVRMAKMRRRDGASQQPADAADEVLDAAAAAERAFKAAQTAQSVAATAEARAQAAESRVVAANAEVARAAAAVRPAPGLTLPTAHSPGTAPHSTHSPRHSVTAPPHGTAPHSTQPHAHSPTQHAAARAQHSPTRRPAPTHSATRRHGRTPATCPQVEAVWEPALIAAMPSAVEELGLGPANEAISRLLEQPARTPAACPAVQTPAVLGEPELINFSCRLPAMARSALCAPGAELLIVQALAAVNGLVEDGEDGLSAVSGLLRDALPVAGTPLVHVEGVAVEMPFKFYAIAHTIELVVLNVSVSNLDTVNGVSLEPSGPQTLATTGTVGLDRRPVGLSLYAEVRLYEPAGPVLIGPDLKESRVRGDNFTTEALKISVAASHITLFLELLLRIDAHKLASVYASEALYWQCWLASVAPGGLRLADFRATLGSLDVFDIECIQCDSDFFSTLAANARAPASREGMERFLQGLLDRLGHTVTNDRIAALIDGVLAVAPEQCATLSAGATPPPAFRGYETPVCEEGIYPDLPDLLRDWAASVSAHPLHLPLAPPHPGHTHPHHSTLTTSTHASPQVPWWHWALVSAAAVAALVAYLCWRRGRYRRCQRAAHGLDLDDPLGLAQHVARTSSLARSAAVPCCMRYGVPLVLVCNAALFLTGHLAVRPADARPRRPPETLFREGLPPHPPQTFTQRVPAVSSGGCDGRHLDRRWQRDHRAGRLLHLLHRSVDHRHVQRRRQVPRVGGGRLLRRMAVRQAGRHVWPMGYAALARVPREPGRRLCVARLSGQVVDDRHLCHDHLGRRL